MSPDVLTDGAWVVVRGVARWVPDPPAVEYPKPELVACPHCYATVSQPCRIPSGRPRSPHATRLVSRRCPCGDRLERGQFCDRCRRERRLQQWREYAERRRQKREGDAA